MSEAKKQSARPYRLEMWYGFGESKHWTLWAVYGSRKAAQAVIEEQVARGETRDDFRILGPDPRPERRTG